MEILDDGKTMWWLSIIKTPTYTPKSLLVSAMSWPIAAR